MTVLKEAHAKVHNHHDRVILSKRKNGYVVQLQERKGNRWDTYTSHRLKNKNDAIKTYDYYVKVYRKNHWRVSHKHANHSTKKRR